jgi:hypothetical protein
MPAIIVLVLPLRCGRVFARRGERGAGEGCWTRHFGRGDTSSERAGGVALSGRLWVPGWPRGDGVMSQRLTQPKAERRAHDERRGGDPSWAVECPRPLPHASMHLSSVYPRSRGLGTIAHAQARCQSTAHSHVALLGSRRPKGGRGSARPGTLKSLAVAREATRGGSIPMCQTTLWTSLATMATTPNPTRRRQSVRQRREPERGR